MLIQRLTAAAVLSSALAFSALAQAAELKIGVLPAADSIVLEVAADEGLFKKEGLDVQTVPFKSALEVGAAMRAGQLAGHFGDLMNVITQNATGAPQKVILTTTHTTPSQRAFGFVVSPKASKQIESVKDLKSTESAMSAATIIDYLLDRMKTEEKLAQDAVKNVEIRQIPIRLQMLLAGKVETALLPEPLVTIVEKRGGRVIWDDTKLNEALAVVALRSDRADARTVAGFRRAVAEAARLIEADPEKYRAVMVEKKLIPAPIAADYKMVRFSLFGTKDGLPPLPTPEDVKRVGDWMIGHQMVKSAPRYEDVVWTEE